MTDDAGGGRTGPTELLDPAQVDAELVGSPWQRQGGQLVLEHRSRDFAEALRFVNAVAALAERADHHPDIDIRWNLVLLRLWTHTAGGLTRRDLALASGITALLGLLGASPEG
jgi:4a-hydroxytetrahydrobiopterin dehydratase